jgi:glycolate oxidase iron-sulfur subunit
MHGQGITQEPRKQLKAVGFEVIEIPGRHFCCGSAGSYNLLQPAMAKTLKNQRLTLINKVSKSNRTSILAAGNIGCIVQLASGTGLQVVHTVELLDWATGGSQPPD